MNDATKEMFNDQLSTAKILVDSINNINWDLAHYIADNALSKLMMLKLYEERGYDKNRIENFNFPTLVETFKTEFPSISIDFDEIKAQHSQGRNPFQHKLITNYLGIRKAQAKLYISLLEELMNILGILNPKSDFSLGLEGSEYRITFDIKESLEFFIENMQNKNYKLILDRLYDEEFERCFDKLFTDIRMQLGELILESNSFVIAIGVQKIFKIIPLFDKEDEFSTSWKEMSIEKQLEYWLNDFKDRVKLLYGFEL